MYSHFPRQEGGQFDTRNRSGRCSTLLLRLLQLAVAGCVRRIHAPFGHAAKALRICSFPTKLFLRGVLISQLRNDTDSLIVPILLGVPTGCSWGLSFCNGVDGLLVEASLASAMATGGDGDNTHHIRRWKSKAAIGSVMLCPWSLLLGFEQT